MGVALAAATELLDDGLELASGFAIENADGVA